MTAAASADVSADLASDLADVHANRTPVRIVGAGTWPTGGRPVAASATIDTTSTRGIIAYSHDDLVITAGAGTTLAEVDDATRRHGQWLAVDPPGSRDATLGGLLATASSGPLSLGFGRTRDLVLGLTTLRSDGTPIRAGANVVKNVAGFDLVRLVTGSWGTLGVITQASFRLHALPIVDETVAIPVDTTVIGDLAARVGLRALQYLALELLSPAISATLLPGVAKASPPASWTLLARIGGNAERVAALAKTLSTLGPSYPVDPSVWTALRSDDALDANHSSQPEHHRCICRTSGPSSLLANTIKATALALASSGVAHHAMRATPHTGIVRTIFVATIPQSASVVHALRQAVPSTVWEELPPSTWPLVPPVADDPISRRIRAVFDPYAQLNPGILG